MVEELWLYYRSIHYERSFFKALKQEIMEQIHHRKVRVGVVIVTYHMGLFCEALKIDNAVFLNL